jgi:asparagine synthase (glutamine-hydrolysing)
VNTCSIAFGDPAFNETQYAQAVADRYKTRHQVEEVDPDDFDLVERLAQLYDEPYADSSAIPTYRVCELARKRVVVALSGDGGDENFAGYRRYKWHMKEERIRSMLPLPLRRSVFGLLGQVYPKADWAPRVLRAKTTFQALAKDSVEAYFHSVSIMGEDMRRRLFSDSFKRSLGGYDAVDVLRQHAARAPTDDPLSLIQYLDIKTYLCGDILTKVDRASMAHSLEVREPLLDHPMMEWLSGLPPSFKLGRGEGKLLFKEAMAPYLPNDILYRPKMGFAVPLANWFRGPLRGRVREALLGATLAQTGYFNTSFLRHLVDQHESGMRDYSAPIWSLLMFDSFLRSVLGVEVTPLLRAAS